MYAYCAATGHVMNFAAVTATPEEIAREMARRNFGYAHPGQTAAEARAEYTVTENETRSGATRFNVTRGTGESIGIFVGTEDQIDAITW